MPEPHASTSPLCPAHQRVAVATCARCGTFLCGECTELLEDAAYCAACVVLLRRQGSSGLRVIRFTFGVECAGLLFVPALVLLERVGLMLPLPGWVDVVTALALNLLGAGLGVWFPGRELRRMALGEAPVQGRWLARAARVLAWVNLALLLFCGWSAFTLIPMSR